MAKWHELYRIRICGQHSRQQAFRAARKLRFEGKTIRLRRKPSRIGKWLDYAIEENGV